LAVQALSSTQEGYDLLAPKFEYTLFRTPDPILEMVVKQIEPMGPFISALDVCCGTGAAMRALRPLCRQRVVGLDFSANMLAVGQRLTADAPGTAALQFVRGNALRMPFHDAFDLAVCFGSFGHILPADEATFVREVRRVLHPGGRFVFITSYRPPLWSPSYWLFRAFNGAMHVRNWLKSPPFIMFYLTFLLPEVGGLLRQHGFEVEERNLGLKWPFAHFRLVVATLVSGEWGDRQSAGP
jgi:ubiquinone/menaquinone biosynthesis C-methylase UbiE